MIDSKEEFIKRYLPDTVNNIEMTHINLDITDLSIPDILRNLNILYPINSKNRNSIQNGRLAIVVLCKTETVEPYSGVLLIISNDTATVDIVSTKYVVLNIGENNITNDDKICETIDRITSYLTISFSDTMNNLPDFYRKFVYDEYESDDDYVTSDY